MADEQARPEVIQEEAEEDEEGNPQQKADGTTEQAQQEQTAEEGKVEAEGTPPADGDAEQEQKKEDGAGDETAGKDGSKEPIEGTQEGGDTPKPEGEGHQVTEEGDLDKPSSAQPDADKQESEEQIADKPDAEGEGGDKQISEGQNVENPDLEKEEVDKTGTDEQTADVEQSGEMATDKAPSGEQAAGDEAITKEQAAVETAGDGEVAASGEEKAEGEEGGGTARADGTPKPEGEAGVEREDGAEGERKGEDGAAGEGGAEGEAKAEGGAEVEGGETVEGAEKDHAAVEGALPADGEGGAEGEEVQKDGETKSEADDKSEPTSPVPQSETFAEGEREESPIAIGERLSRDGTPTLQHDGTKFHSPPEPGTPELGEGDGEEEEEYIEQPQYNREQLIEKYHQALSERQQLQEQNYQLQNKLAEYFRKKKSEDVRQETNVTDQEQRYLKYMANLDELRRQDIEERELYKQQIEELKEKCEEKQGRVDDERMKFLEFKRQVAIGAVNSRSGRPIPPKDIEQYLSMENRKEAEVVNVRLENIKLRNKLRKKEMALKSKEELAEGLHLIDFEQLKIENQTYNEKIEERNEELLKLRKKITSTVQVLTHLKEKLQFVQAENHVQQGILHEVEETAAKKRDILSRTKQARDALRIDNQKLRQNCGLLGNESLLRDFEERKDESEELHNQLERLKMLHAELTLNLNGVRKKIEQAHVGHQ